MGSPTAPPRLSIFSTRCTLYHVVVQLKPKRRYPKPVLTKVCPTCGDPFQTKRPEQKYDTYKCVAAARVAKARAEREARDGGPPRYFDRGFWYVEIDGKRVAEHRLVYEKSRGVTLAPHHRIEHKNGDRSDNRPENLVLANPRLEAYVQQHGKLPADLGKARCTKCFGPREVVSTSRTTGTKILGCKPCGAERQRLGRRAA